MLKSAPALAASNPKNWTQKTLTVALATAFVFTGAACAKSSAKKAAAQRAVIPPQTTPLSTQQTAQLKTLLQSMGEVNALGQKLQDDKTGKSRRPVALTQMTLAHKLMLHTWSASLQQSPGFPQQPGAGFPQQPGAGFPQQPGAGFPQQPGTSSFPAKGGLQTRAENTDCAVNLTLPKDTPDELKNGETTIPTIGVELSGPACPMKYSMLMTGHQDPKTNTIDASMTLTYDAVTDEARKLNDIDHMVTTAHFAISTVQVKTGNGMSTTMNVAMTFDTAGHSQNQGAFIGQNEVTQNIVMTMTGTAMTLNTSRLAASMPSIQGLQLVADTQSPISFPGLSLAGKLHTRDVYQLPTFTGELTSDMTMTSLTDHSADYRMNGQPITEAQFNSYRNAIQLPGAMKPSETTSGPTTQSQKVPLSCTVQVDVPVAGSTTPRSTFYRSCGASSDQMDTFMGRQIHVVFLAQSNYMDVTTSVCQYGHCADDVKFSFLTNRTNTYHAYADDTLVTVTCNYDESCTQQ